MDQVIFQDTTVPVVMPMSRRLSERDVRAALSTDGYTHVRDVDFSDGIWTAKADNAAGATVRLQVDPETGRVIGSDRH